MSRLIRGFLWLLVANGATRLLWAICVVLLIRMLGPDSFGALATVWAFAGLVAGMSDLGIGQVMVREGSRQSGSLRGYLHSASLAKGVLLVPFWLLVAVGCFFWLSPPAGAATSWALVLVLAAATPLVDHYQTLFSQATQVMDRMQVYSIWRIAYYVALVVTFWVMADLQYPLLPVAIAYFVATAIFTALFGWHIKRLVLGIPASLPGIRSMRGAIVQGTPFLLTMVLALAYYRVDTVLLGFLGSNEEAGIYSAQYQIILILYSISAMVFTVVFPDLYRRAHDHAYMQQRFRRIARYLHLLAWLVAPWLFSYANDIMTALGGEPFAAHSVGLRVLSVMLFLFLAAIALNFLTALDRLKARIYCELAALVITIVGGVIAIPTYSISGMAMVANLAYAVSGAGALVVLVRDHRTDLGPVGSDFLRIGFAVAPVMVLFYFFGFPHWWQGVAVFLLLSLSSLTLLRFWDEEDRALLRSIRNMIGGVSRDGA